MEGQQIFYPDQAFQGSVGIQSLSEPNQQMHIEKHCLKEEGILWIKDEAFLVHFSFA